ncbi:hypothetical protein ACLB2K_039423 [Fragaria x ananassa]
MKLVANSQALAPTRSRVNWDASQSEVCRTTETLKHKLQLAQFSVCKTRTPPSSYPQPHAYIDSPRSGPQRSIATVPNQARTDSPGQRPAALRQSPAKRELTRHTAARNAQ